MHFWAFFRAYADDWKTLMSGIGSIILAFWAVTFPPSDNGKMLLLAASAVCFVVASFRIWENEHRQLLAERSKAARPEIAGEVQEIYIDKVVPSGKKPAVAGSFLNLKIYMVNRSPTKTTVKGYDLELAGEVLNDSTIDGSNLTSNTAILLRQSKLLNLAQHINDPANFTLELGIAREGWIRFYFEGKQYDDISQASIALLVIDAWGSRHRLAADPGQARNRDSGITSFV